MALRKNDEKNSAKDEVSLARALSKAGYCSRTDAAKLIRSGRVTVDARQIQEPEFRVNPRANKIAVDGKLLENREFLCFALHKPRGVVTTKSDERGRVTVFDVFRAAPCGKKYNDSWIFPIGRLDRETSGLLLFTNNTRFADLLSAPETKVTKSYEAKVRGRLTDADIESLSAGIALRESGAAYTTKPAQATILKQNSRETLVKITIIEGKNRQVRKMFEAVGHKVSVLHRTAIGAFALGSLAPGECKKLSLRELRLVAQGSRALMDFIEKQSVE